MLLAEINLKLWDILTQDFSFYPLLAMGLILALLFLLPKGDKKRVRDPFVTLCVHFLFQGMHAVHISHHAGDSGHLHFHYIALFFLLCSLGQGLFLLLTKSFLGKPFFGDIPKIVFDLIHGLIYFGALLATLKEASVSLNALVTGSAVMTAAIGLVFRDTLGSVMAGLAIQIEQPFEVGDWIQFDEHSNHVGEVCEINWRATKVVTLDKVYVTIPNLELARAPIRNFTKPERYSRRSIFVVAPYEVPSETVREVILDAIADAWGVLKDPPPSVVTYDFNERGVEYWIRVFTNEFGKRDVVDSAVRDRVWYAFNRHDIRIPAPLRRVELQTISDESLEKEKSVRTQQRFVALRNLEFLEELSDNDCEQLAQKSASRRYGPGEVVVHQGDEGSELFIIQSGEIRFTLEDSQGVTQELDYRGPPQLFGEVSCLTGQPRTASVLTTKECVLIVVDKSAFGPILAAAPRLAEHISEVLARHQNEFELRSNVEKESLDESRIHMLRRIQAFFGL